MNKEEILNKINNEIKNSNNPIIFFDTDADGTTSYVQLKILNEKLYGVPFKKTKEEQEEVVDLVNYDNDLVVFVDIPYIYEEVFEKIKDKNIIWVDHHISSQKDLIEKYNILYFNPLNYDLNDSRPVCYWCYEIVGVEKNLDFASVGSVADFFLLDVLVDLYNYDENKFDMLFSLSLEHKNELIEFIKNKEEKNLDEISSWIRYLSYNSNAGVLKMFFDYIYKLESQDIVNVVKEISKMDIDELLTQISAQQKFPFDKFGEYLETIKSHLKKSNKKNQSKKIAYYYHEGDVSYNRQIAEESLYRLEDVEIFFVAFQKNESNIVSCSFRSKSIPIQETLVETLRKFNGKGGGHDMACGAIIDRDKFPKFKEIILDKFQDLVDNNSKIK